MRSNSASNTKIDKNKTKKNDPDPVKPTDNSQIQDSNIDPALKQQIQQLIDMTNCTQDRAIFALHDSDNDLNAAVLLVLEPENDGQGEWQEQKGKSKKKRSNQPPATEPDDLGAPAEVDNDIWSESRTTDSRPNYARNAPPRMQRGGRRPDYRNKEDGGRDGFPDRPFRGERGRGRGRGGRGRGGGSSRDGGGFNRGGEGSFPRSSGFNRNTEDFSSTDGVDSAPQIGTWTSEADANPKTDSWGEVWGEEDNQWQGDLKSTHVFESSAKADTFPTPTEFDPTVAAASQPISTPSQQQPITSTNLNGNTQQTSLNVDSLFPKQQVETLNPTSGQTPSVSIYDNQLASDSIKNAIGMPTQQQQTEENKVPPQPINHQPAPSTQLTNNIVSSSAAPAGSISQTSQSVVGLPQRQNRQPRSKLPPPSTKIPTAPVEMPHTPAASMLQHLGVQFGSMEFNNGSGGDNSASGLTFQSSSLGNYSSASTSTSQQLQMVQQQSLPNNLYGSGSMSHNNQQQHTGGSVGRAPEPIPFPNSTQHQQQQSNSQQQSSMSSQQQTRPGEQQQSANNSGSNTTLYHGSPSGKQAQVSQPHHGGYNSTSGGTSSQYKPNLPSHSSSGSSQSQGHHSVSQLPSDGSSSHVAAQSFHQQQQQQNSRASGVTSSGGYYHNLQDARVGGGNYHQPSSQSSSNTSSTHSQPSQQQQQQPLQHTQPTAGGAGILHSNQYPNSLYSSSIDQQQQPSVYNSNQYNSGVSTTTSLSGSPAGPITSHVAQLSSQSQQTNAGNTRTSKPPPNLPPPTGAAAAAAATMVPMPMMPMQYYNQAPYYSNLEDLQKYQLSGGAATGYYDMSQYAIASGSMSAFPGTAGSGDGKMTRHDAQSPTVQGSQSTQNQSQQQPGTPANTQNHQQYAMSIPPGYHPNYHYYQPATVMPAGHYTQGIFQMPSATQSMPGTTNNVYSNQKANVSSVASSYYPSTATNSGYEDTMQSAVHTTDYSKGVYGANKQANNLTGGSSSNSDISSMYKTGSNSSQNNPVMAAANMYGANPGAYISAHAGHLLPNQQHLIQSQLGGGVPNAQDANIGGRGSQSVNMAKSHTKPPTYYGGGGGWGS